MAINAKRLLKLADFLETVPRKAFDFSTWGREAECGFEGCAIGWAAHGRIFPGLEFSQRTRRINIRKNGRISVRGAIQSAEKIFDMTRLQVTEVFCPSHTGEFLLSPKQVATRIRKFVRANTQARP